MLNKPFAFLALFLALTSCHYFKSEPSKEVHYESAEKALAEALEYMKEKEYEKASETFETLEKEFPYSQAATKGQIIASYLEYQRGKFALALGNIERFMQMHPTHPNIDYAYYLKAMCYYVQISTAERDQKNSNHAMNAFEELITRYPDSVYSKDARLKLDLIKDHLAGYEMEIGRFYLNKNNAIAAVGRFNNVVQDYPNTLHAREALYRLVEIYLAMGIREEAQKYAAILGYNQSNNPWYHRAYDLLLNTDKYYYENNKWYKKIL